MTEYQAIVSLVPFIGIAILAVLAITANWF